MKKEEALKKVRQMSLPKETMEILEALAPELKESEDERIRRWLCDYFSSIDKAWIHKDITCIDILRWLEKQKEQKPVDYETELKKCKDNPLYFYDKYVSIKQKPAKWSEDDENMLKDIISGLKATKKLIFAHENQGKAQMNARIDWLQSLSERFNLQPNNEWSEEDEKDMAHIIRILDDCYVYGTHDLSKTDRENLVNKLKSLRPQYHGDVTMTEAYKMGLEAGKASSWKPSEEDLMMLEHIIGQYETGNKNSKVMGYLPRIEELDFLKKVFAIWKS